MVSAAYDVFNGKAGPMRVLLTAVTMAKAVVLDERSVYPACTTLRGEYGYNGTLPYQCPVLLALMAWKTTTR